MDTEYRLTIGVCCHADTPFFEEMLDSFLHAGINWPETELLICDDGSPAGGDGDKARRFAACSGLPFSVRVIRHETHWKQAASKQHIREEARGKYLLFFDSDDVFLPFDVIKELDFLDAHTEYCGSYGKKLIFDGEHGFRGNIQGGDFSNFEMLITPPLAINGMIVRTADLREAWGFVLPDGCALNCGDDICMWFGCALRKPFYFSGNFRAMYRQHSGQITFQAEEEYRKSYHKFREESRRISADLLEKIRQGKNFSLPVQRRQELMILLGAEFAESANSAVSHQLLALAATVDPEDYGVREMRIRLLMQEKRFEDALLEAFLLVGEHPESAYIQLVAYRAAVECLPQLNRSAAAFQKLQERIGARHFFLPDQQKQRVDQSIARARELFASGIR